MPAQTPPVLSQRLETLAQRLIETGRYQSISEVLDGACDALERLECDDEAKQAYLDQALEDGEASGIFEGDPFESVRREMGWEKAL